MDFEQTLYRAYFKEVFLYVRSLTAEANLAEEIAQETFTKALKAIDSYDGKKKDIMLGLSTIAKNSFYTHCRRQKHYVEYELPENCTDGSNGIEERLADEETAFLIHKFLHQMEEPYKEVFNLRVFGELPFEKIGAIFGKCWLGQSHFLPREKTDCSVYGGFRA